MRDNDEQLKEIENGIKVLFEPGQVVELRVPNTEREGTIAGWYDDHGKLAKAILKHSGEAPGVYYTLNPCVPGTLARLTNRWKPWVKGTTTDKEIERRRLLLIDFDPVRFPSDISSTNDEKAAAKEVMLAVKAHLDSLGWPEPVIADSGNGYHLLYRIDLPNDDPSLMIVKNVLGTVGQRFSTPAVSIDQKVFNAARITKAYGSLAAKGDSIPERPHRNSKLIAVPDVLSAVPTELLDALAAEAAPEQSQKSRQKIRPATRDAEVETSTKNSGVADEAMAPSAGIAAGRIEEFLAYYGLEHDAGADYEGGLRWKLRECPFDPVHGGDSAVFLRDDGRYGFSCFHNGCSGNDWKRLRPHLESRSGKTFHFSLPDVSEASLADEPPVVQVDGGRRSVENFVIPVDPRLGECSSFLKGQGISLEVAVKEHLFLDEHPRMGKALAIPRFAQQRLVAIQYVSLQNPAQRSGVGSQGGFYCSRDVTYDMFDPVIIAQDPIEALRLKTLGFDVASAWGRQAPLTPVECEEIVAGSLTVFSTFDLPGVRRLEPIDKWSRERIDALIKRGYRHEWRNLFKSPDEMSNAPLHFLIEDFFLEESSLFFGALPGDGKTLVGLSMAKAFITASSRFLGHFKVPEKIPVLYLLPESGEKSLKLRLNSFGITTGEDFLCRTFTDGPMPKLNNPLMLEAAKGRIVVLDTAIRFTDAKDENSAADNRRMAENIFLLLSSGARGVVGLHHAPKSFEQAKFMVLDNVLRGSGDIGAMLGACYGLKMVDREKTRIHVECVKPRDFEPVKPFEIEGRPWIDREHDFRMVGKPGTVAKMGDTHKGDEECVAKIQAYIRANPGVYMSVAREAVGVGHSIFDRLIKARAGSAWIIRPGDRAGTSRLYPNEDSLFSEEVVPESELGEVA